MRLKRQKKNRKTVKFYAACYDFRPPFKVLCDGTFIQHLLVNSITPADTALSNLLGAPVQLFTTQCVLAELKGLGSPYSQSLKEASQLLLARCGHETREKADACIFEVAGHSYSEHFFVATQDGDLRKKFKEVPGVPVVYALRKALLLEPLSAAQLDYVKTLEEQRSHMTQSEYKLLKKRAKSTLTNQEDNDSSDKKGLGDQTLLVQAVTETQNIRGTEMKDKVQFKRKKAKGPNPLSCKKKKTRENKTPVQAKEGNDGSDLRNRARKRKRARRHKQSQGAEQLMRF